MDPIARALLDEAAKAHTKGDFQTAEHRYTSLLNLEPGNAGLLNMLGDVHARQGRHGLAICLFRQALDADPVYVDAWLNLGVAYKLARQEQKAMEAFRAGLRSAPDDWRLLNGIASMYADGIAPEKAIESALMAHEAAPLEPEPKWNLAMALLSRGDWKRGWTFHESRKGLANWHERGFGGAAIWDGSPGKHLVVHGEQGVGDEVMFASCLPDLLAIAASVVIECKDKLVSLMARSFDVRCYPDEASLMKAEHRPEAKIAFGSLPLHFRSAGQFPGKPYLKADPAKHAAARAWLEAQGPGPYVGLAWQGGTAKTRVQQRSMKPDGLMALPGTKVSIQYGAHAAKDAAEVGLPHWAVFSGDDSLDDQAALIAALDAVVTVPQTVVHLAGALGIPCHVLVPSVPNWVFAHDPFPWYRSVALHRQRSAGDWSEAINNAGAALADLGRLQAA